MEEVFLHTLLQLNEIVHERKKDRSLLRVVNEILEVESGWLECGHIYTEQHDGHVFVLVINA